MKLLSPSAVVQLMVKGACPSFCCFLSSTISSLVLMMLGWRLLSWLDGFQGSGLLYVCGFVAVSVQADDGRDIGKLNNNVGLCVTMQSKLKLDSLPEKLNRMEIGTYIQQRHAALTCSSDSPIFQVGELFF